MTQPASIRIGNDLLDGAILIRTEVRQQLNAHWWCEIECRDTLGHAIPGEDALGASCQVTHVDEAGEEHVNFDGFLIDVSLKREVWGSYSALLRAVSGSWLLDQSTCHAYYASTDLSTVCSQIAARNSCSAVVQVTGAPDGPSEYVQCDETDWAFLLRVADDRGGWIRSMGATLEVSNQFDAPAAALDFRGEGSLIEFAIEGELHPAAMRGAHYDPGVMQSETYAGVTKPAEFLPAGARMAGAARSAAQQHGLEGWSSPSRHATLDSYQTRLSSEAERAHGASVVVSGISRQPDVIAGGSIAVSNLNEANGNYNVLEVIHVWTTRGYENHFRATPWKQWRAAERPRVAVSTGPVPARVVANHDPENRGRLQVRFYWQDGETLQWAPLATLHAGAGFGTLFYPEVGDEVFVGFLNADPERPVILGSLWNGVHQPPREPFWTESDVAPNYIKRIVTKSGIRITMNETPGKESMALATPRSNTLLLTEQAAETGRPALALFTQGDIFLNAGGRIHMQSATHSRHTDGKAMQGASVRITDWWGNHAPFETTPIEAQLSDGSTFEGKVASGQQFNKLPPGSNTLTSSKFYVPPPTDASGGESA